MTDVSFMRFVLIDEYVYWYPNKTFRVEIVEQALLNLIVQHE